MRPPLLITIILTVQSPGVARFIGLIIMVGNNQRMWRKQNVPLLVHFTVLSVNSQHRGAGRILLDSFILLCKDKWQWLPTLTVSWLTLRGIILFLDQWKPRTPITLHFEPSEHIATSNYMFSQGGAVWRLGSFQNYFMFKKTKRKGMFSNRPIRGRAEKHRRDRHLA